MVRGSELFDEMGINDPLARRNFIKFGIADRHWIDYSGAAILRELRGAGLGIQKQDFYRLRREKMHEISSRAAFVGLLDNQLVPLDIMIDSHGATLTQKAQYRFKLQVYDPATGRVKELSRSIASNRHMSPSEAAAMGIAAWSYGGEGSNLTVLEADLAEVWIRPGAVLDR